MACAFKQNNRMVHPLHTSPGILVWFEGFGRTLGEKPPSPQSHYSAILKMGREAIFAAQTDVLILPETNDGLEAGAG